MKRIYSDARRGTYTQALRRHPGWEYIQISIGSKIQMANSPQLSTFCSFFPGLFPDRLLVSNPDSLFSSLSLPPPDGLRYSYMEAGGVLECAYHQQRVATMPDTPAATVSWSSGLFLLRCLLESQSNSAQRRVLRFIRCIPISGQSVSDRIVHMRARFLRTATARGINV